MTTFVQSILSVQSTLRASGLAAIAMCLAAASLAAEPVSVQVTNQSQPVACAEKDNIAVGFVSDKVRRFRIEAAHPAYYNAMRNDSFAADWTACDMSGDPAFAPARAVKKPTRKTLFETPELWVVGWTFPTFWRPARTPVEIAGQSFTDIHLIQVWMLRPMGGEEVLVVYPQDGYWRIRPKAPSGRDLTAFGSSFLIGPVTDDGRPVVNLKRLQFDPEARTFHMTFANNAKAAVKIDTVTDRKHVLNITFDTPIADKPFAMLRSMYVTDFNNDAAHIALKQPKSQTWTQAPVLTFNSANASRVWIGRTAISRHNTSSPDHVFDNFASQ